jgi:hypothetical protein
MANSDNGAFGFVVEANCRAEKFAMLIRRGGKCRNRQKGTQRRPVVILIAGFCRWHHVCIAGGKSKELGNEILMGIVKVNHRRCFIDLRFESHFEHKRTYLLIGGESDARSKVLAFGLVLFGGGGGTASAIVGIGYRRRRRNSYVDLVTE